MFRLNVLASGSSGNCTLISAPCGRLLVDAGVSAARIADRLSALGMEPGGVDGILVTHEHGDHCRGLGILARKWRIPVLCNAMTREVLRESMPEDTVWRMLPDSGIASFAGMEIESFPVPHDAVDPRGFIVRWNGSALGVLTDVGHVTPLMRARLTEVDTLILEANYDPDLLDRCRTRPWSTKQRICSRHGHLSNLQAAELVGELTAHRIERVVLAHLSRDCNHPDLATAAVRAALDARTRTDIEVHCAPPHGPGPWLPVRVRPLNEPLKPARRHAPPEAPMEQMYLI